MSIKNNEWTVMVYMSGDNNLNTDMTYTLDSIREALGKAKQSQVGVDLYVYFDGASDQIPTLYCDYSTNPGKPCLTPAQSVENKFGGNRKRGRENEDSASLANVTKFIDWCISKDVKTNADGTVSDLRPEKKYAFIFSGHSFGFLDRGLFRDEKTGGHMTMFGLREMFRRITADAGELAETKTRRKSATRGFDPPADYVILGKPLDLLGFDSCEMSTLEVASQFEGCALTMVASQGSVPNAGWNYAELLLGKVSSAPTAPPETIAVDFVGEFINRQARYAIADQAVDMAAWDLANLGSLRTAFGTFVAALTNCFKDYKTAEYRQMSRVLLKAHWEAQSYLLHQFVDLADLCGLLIDELDNLFEDLPKLADGSLGTTRETAVALYRAVRETILASGFSGSDNQHSNGVSLFFPWSREAFDIVSADYERLSFMDEKAGVAWYKFLQAYCCRISRRGARCVTLSATQPLIAGPSDYVVFETYPEIAEADGSAYGKTAPDGDPLKLSLPNENSRGPISRFRRPNENFRRPNENFRRPTGSFKRPNGEFKRPTGEFRRPNGEFKQWGGEMIFVPRFSETRNTENVWNIAGFVVNPDTVEMTEEGSSAGAGVTPTVSVPPPSRLRGFLEDMAVSIRAKEDPALERQCAALRSKPFSRHGGAARMPAGAKMVGFTQNGGGDTNVTTRDQIEAFLEQVNDRDLTQKWRSLWSPARS